jgi:hypothetical protein
MAALLERIQASRAPAAPTAQRAILSPWLQQYLATGMLPYGYQPGYITSWGEQTAEPIGEGFAGYAVAGHGGNAVVWAIERFRLAVFSEARFQFQQLRKGRPGDLFGAEQLALLERPWAGGTTGDLLTRMLLDADLAGNSFWVLLDGELVRLRPDWVEIVLADRRDSDGMRVGYRKVGYFYYEDGKLGGKPAVFLPGEVAHFAPTPDPLATYRGMSWLTPVLREIQADTEATRHKLKFFEHAATPNLAVSLPAEVSADQFRDFVELMDANHQGTDNAYRTLYTGGGADVTVIGADMRQLDFKVTQGAGESRLAAAGGVHPAIVPLSEGLQGSTLNAGNLGAAKRIVADATLRPLWRNAAGSLEVLLPPPTGARLWYDDRDVAFLREDAKDAAEITQLQAATIRQLVEAGFTPESAKAAVLAGNMDLLVHSGYLSVQLQEPGTKPPAAGGAGANGKAPAMATTNGG